MGVAFARARSDSVKDNLNPFMPAWSAQTVFGEEAVIAGFDANVGPVIDQALKMTGLPGGKIQVGTPNSTEPTLVNMQSPVQGFQGYPR
jgi:hypothetical protein